MPLIITGDYRCTVASFCKQAGRQLSGEGGGSHDGATDRATQPRSDRFAFVPDWCYDMYEQVPLEPDAKSSVRPAVVAEYSRPSDRQRCCAIMDSYANSVESDRCRLGLTPALPSEMSADQGSRSPLCPASGTDWCWRPCCRHNSDQIIHKESYELVSGVWPGFICGLRRRSKSMAGAPAYLLVIPLHLDVLARRGIRKRHPDCYRPSSGSLASGLQRARRLLP
jgi:hypothetical protein